MRHPLARLAGQIDWAFLDGRFGSVCQPGRLVAGLFILKHMHNCSAVLGPSLRGFV
jgi:IS5 family transposase